MSRSRRRIVLAPLAALSVRIVDALAAEPENGHRTALTYVVRMPRQVTAKPPVLFLMHGFGSDEHDLLPLADTLPPTLLVISLRAPSANIVHGEGATNDSADRREGYRWYRSVHIDGRLDGNSADIAASAAAVNSSITQLTHHFGADPRRIFLGGFSQGAIMTYAVTLADPTRFRGAVVLSGALLPAVLEQLANADHATRDARVHLPIFVGHGEADRTIPFAYADQAAMTLAAWRVPLAFNAYAGMGHEVGSKETADLARWMRTLILG